MGGWADKICKDLKDGGKEKQQGTKQEVGREGRTRTRKQISKVGKNCSRRLVISVQKLTVESGLSGLIRGCFI